MRGAPVIMKTIKIVFLAILTCGLAAQSDAGVRVKVQKRLEPGAAIYHYRVFNDAARPITAFYIGYDYFHGVAELGAVPTGWTFENGIPATSVTSKAGWEPVLTTEEESDVHWISWSGAATPIVPGGVSGGFSIRLPQPDATYETGHWTVRFNDSTAASARLELDDNLPPPDGTAPSLSVTLSPSTIWPPNRKMAEVTAMIAVSDDHDPNPIVRLVSISSNEALAANDVEGATFNTDDRQFSVRAARAGQQKQGRQYIVTYRAIDAAGNARDATAVVSIPHDSRR